ncbi:hypothetical protein V2J23_08795 [Geobacillus thermoleovorans]|uniref:hypothetical protein n=1 Tax=Geobacillus thermoleovorans TaxID=33941 RepID=UPI00345C2588
MLASKRWLALQFLEGNERIHAYLQTYMDIAPLVAVRDEAQHALGRPLAEHIYDACDKWIVHAIETSTVIFQQKPLTLTEKIDAVVTNKYLGLPIFLALHHKLYLII